MTDRKKVISVSQVTKRFGDFTAVDAISFDVYEGEIFGFLGANGAGKTTAMKMLIGLSKPTDGEGMVAGIDLRSKPELIKKSIGYMSQKFALYDDLTIKENARFYGGIHNLNRQLIKARTEEMLTRLDLMDSGNKLVGDLSLGWKQRLSFCVSMLHNPPIVFLDEPTGGVDPLTRRLFWEMIYEEAAKGRTIFVTTHYMDEAEYCHRLSMMVNGVIKALDTPANLKKKYGVRTMNEVFVKIARNEMEQV